MLLTFLATAVVSLDVYILRQKQAAHLCRPIISILFMRTLVCGFQDLMWVLRTRVWMGWLGSHDLGVGLLEPGCGVPGPGVRGAAYG